MKKWNAPVMQELDVSLTASGTDPDIAEKRQPITGAFHCPYEGKS